MDRLACIMLLVITSICRGARGWTHMPHGGRRTALRPRLLSLSSSTTTTNNGRDKQQQDSSHVSNLIQETLPKAFGSIGLQQLLENNHAHRCLLKETLIEYADGVSEEVTFDAKDAASVEQALNQYESIRSASSGVGPCLVFGGILLDKRMSSSETTTSNCDNNDDDWIHNSTFRNLLRVGSLISGIDNDIQSQQKDSEEWNYITILTRLGQVSVLEAMDRACLRHEQLLEQYNDLGTQLAGQQQNHHPDWSLAWRDVIGPSIFRGFCSWQAHVKRYKQTTADGTTAKKDLLEKLFPGQPYHIVNEQGHFDGMNVTLRNILHQDVFQWMEQCGLLDKVVSSQKLQALDPALCTLLLLDHANPVDQAILQAFCRFFVCLVTVDDLWEKPALHESVKRAMLKSFHDCL